MVAEARPIIMKKVFGGGGPKMPVGMQWTPSSGVNILGAEAQRSRPALPGVARTREAAEGAEARAEPMEGCTGAGWVGPVRAP